MQHRDEALLEARALQPLRDTLREHPRFNSLTRRHLCNPEAGAAVREVVERELPRYLDEAPAVLDALLLQLEAPTRSSSCRT